jgi:hypothetical protein
LLTHRLHAGNRGSQRRLALTQALQDLRSDMVLAAGMMMMMMMMMMMEGLSMSLIPGTNCR